MRTGEIWWRFGRGTGRRFGSGWISGVLSVTCGALGLGGVLCLLFPDWLTTPAARAHYPMAIVRFLIYVMLVVGFGLGALSALLRSRKVLGLTAIGLATAGTLLGGPRVEISGPVSGTTAVGLDWFLLNLFILALLFVPVERVFALRPQSGIFRPGWTTDLMHFAASHLMVQVTPRFHHWHHAAHPEAVDRNFAVHLPWIDRLFGTAHLPPGRWPDAYGIEGAPVPEGYWQQLAWPFRR